MTDDIKLAIAGCLWIGFGIVLTVAVLTAEVHWVWRLT